MFIQNQYYTTYKSIIDNALKSTRCKSDGMYYENHHIIPKSMGGRDGENNMVLLTAQEHFRSHELLSLCTSGVNQYKMIHAWKKMRICNNDVVNSDEYGKLKALYSKIKSISMSARMKKLWADPHFREQRITEKKNRIVTNHTRSKMAKAKRGKARSTETKRKLSEANKGKQMPTITCPHCSKSGAGNSMKRWHFNNCRENNGNS